MSSLVSVGKKGETVPVCGETLATPLLFSLTLILIIVLFLLALLPTERRSANSCKAMGLTKFDDGQETKLQVACE